MDSLIFIRCNLITLLMDSGDFYDSYDNKHKYARSIRK
jgi:hypothetical protein